MLKNIQLYRLPTNWQMTAAALHAALAPHAFTPASSNELTRSGWVPPRDNGDLVHSVNRQFLLRYQTEKKLLPATVINQVTKARAAEMEEAQGFAPGKKAMKELKESVADELLPRAFSVLAQTWVWIDTAHGWLVVDSATATRADEIIKALLKAVDRMPLESVRVARSPVSVMTEWLQADDAPAGFTVDMDADMQATGESKAKVKYVRHTLEADEVRRHIAAGKQCTRLAMTWDSKISFVLTDTLAIKSVKALDVLKETENSTRNADERFDGDFMLMTGELAKLFDDLMEALGGEVGDLVSPARKLVADTKKVKESDKGLLELCAKITGDVYYYGDCWRKTNGVEWNPYLIDADAERLAADAGLELPVGNADKRMAVVSAVADIVAARG